MKEWKEIKLSTQKQKKKNGASQKKEGIRDNGKIELEMECNFGNSIDVSQSPIFSIH